MLAMLKSRASGIYQNRTVQTGEVLDTQQAACLAFSPGDQKQRLLSISENA